MRILIIEDDINMAQFLKVNLRTECFIVDCAFDGERGSFLGRTNEYDLIILDNILPKKSGKDVCMEIRKQGRMMPILMLSAVLKTEVKTDLLNGGADDYMTKPFSFDELLARVRALLRRPAQVIGDILHLDNLELDVKSHRVRRAGNEIHLTRKEFALLEYMLRNQGIGLSRASIMDHVWDIHADPFSNTIEAHILSVRKKIDGFGQKKLVHTISGLGYMLDVRP